MTGDQLSDLRGPRAGRNTALWLIVVLLAFIAGALLRPGSPFTGSIANAQTPALAGARGVYAFTGQIGPNQHGLFMLDIEQGTVWCYEINKVDGVRKLRLFAARTWIYDRYLRDFNCADPDYRMIRDLVAQQRDLPPSPAGEVDPLDTADGERQEPDEN